MSNPPASPAPPPPPAALDAAVPGLPSTPDWTVRYFQALAQHRQKARAALAAGQPLPVVVRRRRVDPAFAQHEAEILECLADVLESEAIRRATATGPIHKICSDALLNRLLKIFHPKYEGLLSREHTAFGAPSQCRPQRPIRAKGEFNFESALQRLEFHQWEREQAIAVALELFYMSPEELDALCPLPRPAYRGMTKWPGPTASQTTPAHPSPAHPSPAHPSPAASPHPTSPPASETRGSHTSHTSHPSHASHPSQEPPESPHSHVASAGRPQANHAKSTEFHPPIGPIPPLGPIAPSASFSQNEPPAPTVASAGRPQANRPEPAESKSIGPIPPIGPIGPTAPTQASTPSTQSAPRSSQNRDSSAPTPAQSIRSIPAPETNRPTSSTPARPATPSQKKRRSPFRGLVGVKKPVAKSSVPLPDDFLSAHQVIDEITLRHFPSSPRQSDTS